MHLLIYSSLLVMDKWEEEQRLFMLRILNRTE